MIFYNLLTASKTGDEVCRQSGRFSAGIAMNRVGKVRLRMEPVENVSNPAFAEV